MRSFITVLCLISLCALHPHARAASELEQRRAIDIDARSAFARSDFQELNQKTHFYRINKNRSASGLWLLTLYYAGLDQAVRAEVLSNGDPDHAFANLEKKTAQWARSFPDSPAAHMVHARVLINHAWAYRGGGLAADVVPKNWAPFHAYIAQARRYLEMHKKVASVDPSWYEVMLMIATAQQWKQPEFERLLTEALDREPEFYQTYFRALLYLLPKWHGSIAAIERFARDAAKRTAATDGRGMYARIYWFASQAEFENNLFEDSLIDWPRMRDGFDDVIKRYPDAWNLNNYAKFACLARDRPKARELMQRIVPNFIPDAWTPETLIDECMQLAAQSSDAGMQNQARPTLR